eukprot:TRINITY_DN10438_c0_g2_i1.p1 TRINITY_DN10438_c0_g2~~TRINITY_DN10438_c0_g2_i1.p1  ORF type:complete len:464 (+),score=45.97 TRINITY_DN10438_c0_g2_i1:56-1447(+)
MGTCTSSRRPDPAPLQPEDRGLKREQRRAASLRLRQASTPAWIEGAPSTERRPSGPVQISGTLPCFLCESGDTDSGSAVLRHVQLLSGRVRFREWACEQGPNPRFVLAGSLGSRAGIECRLLAQSGSGQDLVAQGSLRQISRRKHRRADGQLYVDCAADYQARGDAVSQASKLQRAAQLVSKAVAGGAPYLTAGRTARCAEIYEAVACQLVNDHLPVLDARGVSLLATAMARADSCALRSDGQAAVQVLISSMKCAFDHLLSLWRNRHQDQDGLLALRAAVEEKETRQRNYSTSPLRRAAQLYALQRRAARTSQGVADKAAASTAPQTEAEFDDEELEEEFRNDIPPDVEVPDEFLCPITLVLMLEPVRTPGGIVYEREAIEAWVKVHGTCPATRASLTLDSLEPHTERVAQIKKWRREILERRGSGSSSVSADGAMDGGSASAHSGSRQTSLRMQASRRTTG